MVTIDGKTLAMVIDTYCLIEKTATKDDFCAATGISSATLSQWRTGKYDPSKKKVENIERHVGMPIDKFMSTYGVRVNETKIPATDGDGLTEDEKEIIRLFRSASPATRSAMLHLLRSAEAAQSVPGDGEAK